MSKANVYRYRDSIAVYVGNGQTVYFSALEAAKLGAAITKAAREIKRGVPFADSNVGTFSIGDA